MVRFRQSVRQDGIKDSNLCRNRSIERKLGALLLESITTPLIMSGFRKVFVQPNDVITPAFKLGPGLEDGKNRVEIAALTEYGKQ